MPNIIISLDFELRWGVHQLYGENHNFYRSALENVHHITPLMLKMFSERGLKATWATVGALLLNSWDEYFNIAPSVPNYKNKKLCFNEGYAKIDPEGLQYFAPNLVDLIINTDGQELGGHGFSHIFLEEEGVTENDFIVDTEAMIRVFQEKYNSSINSYVFPRNQIRYQNVLKNRGINAWRSNNCRWFNNANLNDTDLVGFAAKALRLLDSLTPMESVCDHYNNASMANIFVRFSLPDSLWRLHLYKIKNQIYKLKSNNILHLWWHPHNLGIDFSFKMERLRNLLDILSDTCHALDIVSSNMKDLYVVDSHNI